jgi:hypothetical protein
MAGRTNNIAILNCQKAMGSNSRSSKPGIFQVSPDSGASESSKYLATLEMLVHEPVQWRPKCTPHFVAEAAPSSFLSEDTF